VPWGEGLGKGVWERRGAVRVAGDRPGLRAADAADHRGDEDRHAVVRHPHRREPPDRLPVAAGGDVGVLPKEVAPSWGLGDIYRGMGQFMVLQLIGLALCIIFPGIALWFPRWLFSK
jgi:hypothetical protein